MNELRNRRILHLYWRLTPQGRGGATPFCGGAQKIASQIATSCCSLGARVSFASDDDSASLGNVTFLREHGVTHLRIPFGDRAMAAWILARLALAMKKERIELLHCHDRRCALLGGVVSNALNIPMVYTAHNTFGNSRFMGHCFGRNIVAVSKAVRENLVGFFGVPEERITVIYNGSELQPSSTAAQRQVRARFHIDERSQLLTVVGRLSMQKGHEYLIRALPEIVARYPRVKVLSVGGGELKDKLYRLAVHLSVSEHIVFCGQRNDVAPFIDISHFTVLPTLWEGMGMAIIESFLLGKPVIASAVGGVRELVKHGSNGLLVPPKCPRALATAVCSLLADPDRVRGMGVEGQRLARMRFSLPGMLGQYKEYYAKVLLARQNSIIRSRLPAPGQHTLSRRPGRGIESGSSRTWSVDPRPSRPMATTTGSESPDLFEGQENTRLADVTKIVGRST